MSEYSAAEVLGGLKDFQRATVRHVMSRYFGTDDPTRRFLVADETGLGKSVIARGVVASLYERLQDEPSRNAVNVVYVCSNFDIASQNLARLKVTTQEAIAEPSRLTLLAKHIGHLRRSGGTEKPLNLISFTPGTSFDHGWATGTAEERAMLFLMLEDRWTHRQIEAAYWVFQATLSSPERVAQEVEWLRSSLAGDVDDAIRDGFLAEAESHGALDRVDHLITRIAETGTRPLHHELKREANLVTAALRTCLARAGVTALQPDLVILDEFQRFRHLMQREEGNEAAELAHHLFDHPNARVLLLSAAPYKPFTLAGEAEDHYEDFRATLSFLCNEAQWKEQVEQSFSQYRNALIAGTDAAPWREQLRSLLLRVMARTERPALEQEKMLVEKVTQASCFTSADLVGYAAMRKTAKAVEGQVTIEYWKSAPYFLNFTEGYKVGDKLRKALAGGGSAELESGMSSAQLLDAARITQYRDIDPGNARLRNLLSDTVHRGWWKLLWIPPSMPYYQLEEPFQTAATSGITKRLLFSSWNATPTAVAALLSYEADRCISGDKLGENSSAARQRVAKRLDYRMDPSGRPAAMSALTLFWPHPGLAQSCAPLSYAQREPERALTLTEIEQQCRNAVEAAAPDLPTSDDYAGDAQPWKAYFTWGGPLPRGLTPRKVVRQLGGDERDDGTTMTGLTRHVELALKTAQERLPAARAISDISGYLASLGMHSPGNIAWRAIDRQLGAGHTVEPIAHWSAAFALASRIRSVNGQFEVTAGGQVKVPTSRV